MHRLMKKLSLTLIIIVIIMSLIIISIIFVTNENKQNQEYKQNQENQGKVEMKINIEINDRNFEAILEDNETSKELIKLLPLTIEMNDVNNNEKAYYLDKNLPTNNKSANIINRGDIMLWGNDCLVIFYESFNTPYSYTRIGHITNTNNLKEALMGTKVVVTLKKS